MKVKWIKSEPFSLFREKHKRDRIDSWSCCKHQESFTNSHKTKQHNPPYPNKIPNFLLKGDLSFIVPTLHKILHNLNTNIDNEETQCDFISKQSFFLHNRLLYQEKTRTGQTKKHCSLIFPLVQLNSNVRPALLAFTRCKTSGMCLTKHPVGGILFLIFWQMDRYI